MARFSIIIPVYNVEKYLDDCVQSVVDQTYQDYEIILVNDGSTDSSPAHCDDWARKDERIRVIHQKNQGLSGARNTGIRAAAGEYLMFLDSDDLWSHGAVLETVAQRLEKTHPDVLSFSYRKLFGSRAEQSYFGDLPDAPEDLKAEDSLLYMVDKGIWITGAWNKVLRRDLTESHDLLFRPGIISEDIDWSLRLALCAWKFDYIGETVVLYRQRMDSLSHHVSLCRVEDMAANVEECLRLLESAEPGKAALLKPFTAFQYATVVYNYAGLSKQDRTREITARVKGLRHLLRWSGNSKVKTMYLCSRVMGFPAMVRMLRCWEFIQRVRSGGTTK